MPCQSFRIPLGDLGGGNAAAVRTSRAINRVLNFLGNRLKAALDKVMPLHPGTEAEVFPALLLPEPLDLHEIGDHLTLPVSQVDLAPQTFFLPFVGFFVPFFELSPDNRGVTDQLFLSIWLERNAWGNRLVQFEKLLRLFPFSQREQGQSVISIHAIDTTEPPLLERPVNGPIDLADVLTTLHDYQGDDVAYRVESWWDIWQFEADWEIRPSRVALSCFGPEFDNGTEQRVSQQEDLRIDFGLDINYLPRPESEGGARLIESNIKSLLRLVHELETTLPVQKRRLETESGENFAIRLQQMLTSVGGLQ